MKTLLIAEFYCNNESAPRYYLLLKIGEADIIKVLGNWRWRDTLVYKDTPRMPKSWRPGCKLPRMFKLRFNVPKLPLRGIACVWKIDAAGCRKIWIREG